MLTSKQISYLRKLSVNEPDIVFVGKDGLTEEVITQAREAIAARELIKGKVQKNSMEEPSAVAQALSEAIKCDVVCTMGSKFVLYKHHNLKPKIELPKKSDKKKK
ncbi:MAG: YhbY family RNA-binding protein [Eubacterium aggregans]|uniref:RNA-binding protein n=1 Tax=Eubacterium aggregans TaxID=81409 RepID=A0A1H4DBF2_9FIRM|nr:YhbY family RNA-binding protein [Eubacterium aggregans]MDD4690824.1 YhbY family RNA-binding protein [Eubacterium aggregans]MEA5074398.1 YhbY family RNA-binding protein [Eubacterium aggregans]SEA69987.1 RNA-binding protein [Eubacterium aggregans]